MPIRVAAMVVLIVLWIPSAIANGSSSESELTYYTSSPGHVNKPVGATERKPVKFEKPKKPVHSSVKTFDMDVLIERLKKTDAIGIFTKLALRSNALDLMGMMKAYHEHVAKYSLKNLRARFDGLILTVLALLNHDPKLSRDISMGRDQIWKSLLALRVKSERVTDLSGVTVLPWREL